MKIYTTSHGRRNPDGWVVVPIASVGDLTPRYVAIFDTEGEAVALAARLNGEVQPTPAAAIVSRGASLQERAEALWLANKVARAMHETGDYDSLFSALEPVRAALRSSDPRIFRLARRIHSAWQDLFAEEMAAAERRHATSRVPAD